MRILFVVPYAPTPIRTRPYNLLRALARRGHSVTLATLWENEQERAALEQLEKRGIYTIAARLTKARSARNCLRALTSDLPLQSVYCWQPALCERLHRVMNAERRTFDVVHVEHLRGARYGLEFPISNLQSPVVWDSVDCISYLFAQAAHASRSPFGRLVSRFELPRTMKYEAWVVNQFDRVLVTSPVDRNALEALAKDPRHYVAGRVQPVTSGPQSETITVLPNGVDFDDFSPAPAPREPATVVLSGKMSYHANVTAALHLLRDIMPLVWKERGDVHVQIVGQNPPRQVRDLAARYPSLVAVTGTVADLRPYLQRATLAVAPMSYGAGIQNKVLEAMACATPVVATSQAVSALEAHSGNHVLIADEPADFARQILRLLDDRNLQFEIGRAGRRYVEQHHAWEGIVTQLEGIYRELIGQLAVKPTAGAEFMEPALARN